MAARSATITRTTQETDISLSVDLDRAGHSEIETGVPFLDHMLHALATHGWIELVIETSGDVHIDPHHTVEDVGIVLGQAVREALGDRRGIERFGAAYAPLDEALARVVIDCSGRPYLDYRADFPEPIIGRDFAASLVEEFWRAFAVHSGLTIHIDLLRARNSHHAAEAIFKAAAVALRTAIRPASGAGTPSTKGMLE